MKIKCTKSVLGQVGYEMIRFGTGSFINKSDFSSASSNFKNIFEFDLSKIMFYSVIEKLELFFFFSIFWFDSISEPDFQVHTELYIQYNIHM